MKVEEITGIGEFGKGRKDLKEKAGEDWYFWVPSGKIFLVERSNTIEVRCDSKLSQVLREQYESVMQSRYFGRGGIEIVLSGQLSEAEIEDLVRLSYNLTLQEDNE